MEIVNPFVQLVHSVEKYIGNDIYTNTYWIGEQ